MTPEEALREVEGTEKWAAATYRQAHEDAYTMYLQEVASAKDMAQRTRAAMRYDVRVKWASSIFFSAIDAAWEKYRKATQTEENRPAE